MIERQIRGGTDDLGLGFERGFEPSEEDVKV